MTMAAADGAGADFHRFDRGISMTVAGSISDRESRNSRSLSRYRSPTGVLNRRSWMVFS